MIHRTEVNPCGAGAAGHLLLASPSSCRGLLAWGQHTYQGWAPRRNRADVFLLVEESKMRSSWLVKHQGPTECKKMLQPCLFSEITTALIPPVPLHRQESSEGSSITAVPQGRDQMHGLSCSLLPWCHSKQLFSFSPSEQGLPHPWLSGPEEQSVL